jgi:hypothetical protein
MNKFYFLTSRALSLIIYVCLIYSCSKEKDITQSNLPINTTNSEVSPYTQMRVGNYWIYQYYNFDSLGNATPGIAFDSCFVEKDTILNGLIYHKYRTIVLMNDSIVYQNPLSYILFRDSAGFTMGGPGHIYFTSSALYDTLDNYMYTNGMDTLYDLVVLIDRDSMINVPAGSYSTISRKRTQINSYSTFCNSSYHWRATSVYYERYSENIGKVLISNKTISDCQIYRPDDWWEERLIRHHVVH